jgi:hypothetical protein
VASSIPSDGGPERGDAGYATAAFGVMALGMSLIAAAVMAQAMGELRAARLALAETRRDAVLDSALTVAADAVMREADNTPLSWSAWMDGHTVQLRAEPEGGKLYIAATTPQARALVADLAGGKAFDPLAVETTVGLAQARLRLTALADSPAWKACAASLFSPLSRADRLAMAAPRAPAGEATNWRGGEVWRLVAVDAFGRGADALVRFTGDPAAPMAMLDRRTGAMTPPDLTGCLEHAERKPA